MDRESKKALILKCEGLLSKIYWIVGRNRVKVAKENTSHINNALFKVVSFILVDELVYFMMLVFLMCVKQILHMGKKKLEIIKN